jgi:hypothetical protein
MYLMTEDYVHPGLQLLALLYAARHWHEDWVVHARITMFVPAEALADVLQHTPCPSLDNREATRLRQTIALSFNDLKPARRTRKGRR